MYDRLWLGVEIAISHPHKSSLIDYITLLLKPDARYLVGYGHWDALLLVTSIHPPALCPVFQLRSFIALLAII